MQLQPTMMLRWARIQYQTVADPNLYGNQPQVTAHYNVLQQWWTDTYGGGEWRDVPVADVTPNAALSGPASSAPLESTVMQED